MRIGILTLPLHTNYGGILQAYALQTVLERMGHNVAIIQKSRRNTDVKPNLLHYIKAIISRFLLGKSNRLNVKKAWKEASEVRIKEDAIVRKFTWCFVQKHFKLYEIDSFSQIPEYEFDAIIVGSDQIWRALYIDNTLCSIPENAFLAFASNWKNIRRISYAASFGVDYWEFKKKDTKKIKELIKLFDAVSVREKTGISLCRQFLGYDNAVQMPDPTLLLSECDYEELIPDTPKSSGNLHCYILDETDEKLSFISKFAEKQKLNPFFTNSKTDFWSYPIEERIQPPLEYWLRAFYDADFVITDSFHACVFSIIFRKNFLVIGNAKRGMARFNSLLTDLGLEKQLICSINDYDTSENVNINFDAVYQKLNTIRANAYRFLESNLKL